MNGRFSRLHEFLSQFEELKAATGNDPKALRTFDQTTDEIRTAASRMHDYLVGSVVEREIFHGEDKIIVHAPENIERSWNEFKQFWEQGINYLAMCDIDPDRDVYIIAARLLGLYSLVSAVPALQRLARYTLDYRFYSGPAGEYTWAGLVEASMYLAGGAFLIFLASGIADLFSRAHGLSERPTTDNVSRSQH